MRNGFENEWKVSGEVFYLKEMLGEFSASLKIRVIASRPDLYASSILEFPCLMTPTAYNEAKRLGLRKHLKATLSGHLESWTKNEGTKIYFIADKVEKVGGWKFKKPFAWWHVMTYATDKEGYVWGRYNPQEKPEVIKDDKGKIILNQNVVNFYWILPATEENRKKIIAEVSRLAFGE